MCVVIVARPWCGYVRLQRRTYGRYTPVLLIMFENLNKHPVVCYTLRWQDSYILALMAYKHSKPGQTGLVFSL